MTKRSLNKRFFSKGSGAWTDIYDNLRSDSSRGGEGSLSKENFHRVIIGDDGKKKQCVGGNNGDGFLSVNLEGSIVDRMNFGYTFVGTISPTFHIEEAYGYFDGTTTYEVTFPEHPWESVMTDFAILGIPKLRRQRQDGH